MDRKRIRDEVIEILCNKLPALPLPTEDPDFDYDGQVLIPEITDNDLDIAEVVMDLEDAFDVPFSGPQPGEKGMEKIADIIDYIHKQLE
ncbi:MAG: hypothetical protein PF961_15580 [Planctomycetota bacterium]|jgi:hypothetical protein|nr:hypothetical protein [Planctomycetota bacterium]